MLRIGHRGAAGHAPENTLASIRKAVELGAEFVEVDVQATRDGHLILMHDKRVDRTTDGHGYVAEMCFDEVRSLLVGGAEPVPTLAEALETVAGDAGLMIEIITPRLGRSVQRAIAAMRTSRVLYASFHHQELLAVREADPGARTVALLEGVPIDPVGFARACRSDAACLAFDSVTPEHVDALHQIGTSVFVYTLDDPRDIERAFAMRVEGIVSNYPERVPFDS